MIHFRVGKTDGVSIEMASWRDMLEKNGAEVRFCAGPESLGAEYVIDELEQQLNEDVFLIDQEAFGGFEEYENVDDFIIDFEKISSKVEVELNDVFEDFKPETVIVSNIFCVGEGLPIPKAILNVLDRFKPKTIVINHDFYWEEARYKDPSCEYVNEYLETYLPPDRPYITHCTINSIGQRSLKERRGIESTVFYDTFDFDNTIWEKRNSITDLLKSYDIYEDTFVFLQATRVVRRKNIELAIDFVKTFENEVAKSDIKFPYRKVVLLLAGYVERRDINYLETLIEYSKEVGVDLIYMGDRMHTDYELFDIYPYGDVITYPSEYEGFGNQLLEAFNVNKPIVVFEYPVFKTDIKKLGFDLITLGDKIKGERANGLKSIDEKVMSKAVNRLIEILENHEELEVISKKNKSIANENFGHKVTEEKLLKLLN